MESKETVLKEKYFENVMSLVREELIDEILLQYIKNSNIDANEDQKISFFIGGGSNSGKSSFREALKRDNENLLIVDADEMKKIIPEYEGLLETNSEVAASIVHAESSEMASKLLVEAIKRKISTIFDGTLKNKDKYLGFFKILREAGFFISLIIVDVPVHIALERNRVRYEKAKKENNFPRLVPDKDVILSHSSITQSFLAFKDLVDEWVIIDTRGSEDEVIANGKKGIEEVLHEEKYREFLEKGVNHEVEY